MLLAGAALAAANSATPAAAQGTCSRELLQGIADSWIAGVEEGTPFKMNLGEWVEFWQDLELGSMSLFFDKPREVLAHHVLLDTAACKAFVETTVVDPDGRRVIPAQVSNGFFGVSPMHVIITEKPAAGASESEWRAAVPGQTRAQLTAAADEYLSDKNAGPVSDRLYVVDEVAGAVNVFAKAGADQRPTSFTLFVRDGKVATASTIAR